MSSRLARQCLLLQVDHRVLAFFTYCCSSTPRVTEARAGNERTRCIGRVQNVNVDADIDLGIPHPLSDLLNHAVGPETVEGTRRDHLEPAPSVVVQIGDGTGEGGSDARVDTCVGDEPLGIHYCQLILSLCALCTVLCYLYGMVWWTHFLVCNMQKSPVIHPSARKTPSSVGFYAAFQCLKQMLLTHNPIYAHR